uniref:Uncharacterized protein n=1 Tax=Cacopsylla melanoneura TaxID=428564 RepID=A0A8D8ZCT9_9HEMI
MTSDLNLSRVTPSYTPLLCQSNLLQSVQTLVPSLVVRLTRSDVNRHWMATLPNLESCALWEKMRRCIRPCTSGTKQGNTALNQAGKSTSISILISSAVHVRTVSVLLRDMNNSWPVKVAYQSVIRMLIGRISFITPLEWG